MTNKVSDKTLATSIAETSFVYVIDSAGTSDFKATLALLRTEIIDPLAISSQSEATAASGDFVLILDTSDSPNALKKANVSTFLSGSGDLLADGTVPLTANWDVGAFTITGTQFISDIATGTAPFVVSSTTVVTNLNADTVDGVEAAAFGLVANPLSQFAATTSLQLKGVLSDETGSGALVFATSPTLVTPALGTPASGVATNLTGTAAGLTAGNVTTNANLTGHVTSTGNAAILGSFTKSQLTAAVSDGTPLYSGDVTTNATHTGDATGDTALTLAAAAISGKATVTADNADFVLILDTSDSPNALKKALVSDFGGGGAFTADGDTQITPTTPIVLDQATGNEIALDLQYTVNKATSGNDTGLLVNMTDTASPGTSLLADFQVGGASAFRVLPATSGQIFKIGNNAAGPGLGATGSGSHMYFYVAGLDYAALSNAGLNLGRGEPLSFSSGSPFGEGDLVLIRDAANTLAQRRTTNAQTYNIYNTHTDASNYERLAINGDGTITTEAAGTGTQANLVLNGANRAAHIVDVSSGTDTAYETAINAIIATLESHGLAATS